MAAEISWRAVWKGPDGFVYQNVLCPDDMRPGETEQEFCVRDAEQFAGNWVEDPNGDKIAEDGTRIRWQKATYWIKHIDELPLPLDVIRPDHARRLFRSAWDIDAAGNVFVDLAKAKAEVAEDCTRLADYFLEATALEQLNAVDYGTPQERQAIKALRDEMKGKANRVAGEIAALTTLQQIEDYWPFTEAEEEKVWKHVNKRREAPGQKPLKTWAAARRQNERAKAKHRERRR